MEAETLGEWIRRQRQLNHVGKLSQERYDMLSEINMDWDNAAKKRISSFYEQGFQHLEKFVAEKGISALTVDIICEDGYRLGHGSLTVR